MLSIAISRLGSCISFKVELFKYLTNGKKTQEVFIKNREHLYKQLNALQPLVYTYRGTSGIDIDLRRVDIDQCPQRNTPGTTQPLNIFAGTDKCKQRTTMVSTDTKREEK